MARKIDTKPSPHLVSRLKRMNLRDRISHLLRYLDSVVISDEDREFFLNFKRELSAIKIANSSKPHSGLVSDSVAVYRFQKLLRTKLRFKNGNYYPKHAADREAWIHGGAQAVVKKHYSQPMTLEHAHLYYVASQRHLVEEMKLRGC